MKINNTVSKNLISWDSNAFLSAQKRGFIGASRQIWRDRQFANTVDIVNAGGYVTENGKEVVLPNDSGMMSESILYSRPSDFTELELGQEEMTVFDVINDDCMVVTEHLVKDGYNPALLNLANGYVPGAGKVRTNTQEEAILRQTNLFRSLYQFDRIGREYGVPARREHYPLNERFGGVYSPGVILFRDGESAGYKLKENLVSFAVITVAAINRPKLNDAYHLTDSDAAITKNKIRTILRIGYLNGHDALVLGAFGCGAFGNPPSHMARLFHQVFSENEFKGRFKKVVFAIIDDNFTGQYFNPNGNFKPFYDEFMNTPTKLKFRLCGFLRNVFSPQWDSSSRCGEDE